MPFESQFAPSFNGNISAFHHELPGAVAPSTIIGTNQEWHIHIDWNTWGPLNPFLEGNWHIHCYLESMGPGDDVDLTDINDPNAPHIVPLVPNFAPPQSFYSTVLTVKPNAVNLPGGTPMVQTGLYKLVVAMTYYKTTNSGQLIPGPIAAYQEGPILQFYDPDPTPGP